MSGTACLRNGCCGRIVRLRRLGCAVAWASIVVLVAGHVRGADDGPPDPGTARVGLNQSVALEHAVATPSLADRAEAPPPVESHYAAVDMQNTVATHQAAPTRRVFGKFSTSQVQSPELHGATGPWHTTGLGALAIVLAIVGGLFCLLRRWVPAMRCADSGLLRVIGRSSLTPKHHVALIQFGKRFLAVGICGDSMTTLCEVDDPEEVAELTSRCGVRGARTGGAFVRHLRRETAEYDTLFHVADETAVPASAPVPAGRGPVRELLQKLQTLRSA
ncbi:MAG: FliO/MopB family protein [Phycisphaerae bacterium]